MAKYKPTGLFLALSALAFGCSQGGETPTEASPGQRSSAQPFEIRVPQQVLPEQVVLAAADTLNVGDSVKLLEPDQTRASVSNVGASSTNIGVEAELRDLWSVAGVTLRERTHVFGAVRSQGTVTRHNDVIVEGLAQQNIPLETSVFGWEVDFPSPQRDVIVGLDQSTTLTPGGYGVLQAQLRARVTLSQPGAYYFSALLLEPESVLDLRNSTGPIYIFVSGGRFTYRTSLQKENPALHNVMFGYLGGAEVIIDVPFVGTLVAPNAKVNVISSSQGHAGAIYAKSIDVAQPNTVFTHRAFTPGNCETNRTASAIGFGCSDVNGNGKADECPAGSDLTDTDKDGTPDCLDMCVVDATKRAPGVCGCNTPDVDSDGDGLLDCQDSCPSDPTNASCITRDGLPPARPVPVPPGTKAVSPVDLAHCTAERGGLAPFQVRPPTREQLQSAFDAVPNTGAACEAIQNVDAAHSIQHR